MTRVALMARLAWLLLAPMSAIAHAGDGPQHGAADDGFGPARARVITDLKDRLLAVAFSPKGDVDVAGADGFGVSAWDANTGQKRQDYPTSLDSHGGETD